MTYKVGYMADLSGAQFDDATRSTWIQALPIGTYHHPVYGKIESTPEKCAEMAANVEKNVRGTQLDIDYGHKVATDKAAGWVKKAEARGAEGLWVLVEWTKKAYKSIKAGEYRYFSPEFQDDWKHPQTQVVHKNVLFGGGITNRPFLKDILPINLSEFNLDTQHNQEGTGMDPKKLRTKLGLPEDATDEQVEAKLDEQSKAIADAAKGGEGDSTSENDNEQDKVTQPIAATEGTIQEVIRLAESHEDPTVKALAGLVGSLHNQVSTQGAALHLSETNLTVRKLSDDLKEKGYDLDAATQKKLSEVFLTARGPEQTKSLTEMIETLTSGLVKLGEEGPANSHGDGDGDEAIKKFSDAVEKKMSDNKGMTYGDAASILASEQPELFASYQAASYQFKE